MKEQLSKWKETATAFWTERSKKQKNTYIGSAIIIFFLIIGIIFLISSNHSQFVPLYSNLSIQETSQIQAELETRGVPHEIQSGGTTVTVPEDQVDRLLVDLAGQGIPRSGNIDYSFFSENSSFGITDNEFNIMKLDAMQTELANLITGIEGIHNAEVMINLAEERLFVGEEVGETTAAIVIHTQPGYQFEGNQIRALYHLVSKAIPNLQEDNIGIMNQYFEYYDLESGSQYATQNVHAHQQSVKKDVERDVQRRLQQMLGAMVGAENVIVSVTADIDFTQENRLEELVEPVDIENIEGLPVSIESIQESYTGGADMGGTPGTGEEDIANYPGGVSGDDGEYEMDREAINYEFNRIRREIEESPYKIRDLGIQVAVDAVKNRADGAGEAEFLNAQEQNAVEQGISSVLNSIIATSVDASYGEVDPDENISIVFQEFTSSPLTPEVTESVIPAWLYISGAILLIIVVLLIILLMRRRSTVEETEEEFRFEEKEIPIPDLPQNEESESVVRRKQLEKIAREKPEDFAKLLRSWISED